MITEAKLCAWFQGVAEEAGFTVYNEWGGFDQLLVAEDGTQIGVEAKLRANAEVLSQAIQGWAWRRRGPQRRAVLVPKASASFRDVADALGVVVFMRDLYPSEKWAKSRFWTLREGESYQWGVGVELPPYMPDVTGGKPCPVRLTPWKIQAIKLCLRLREQSYLVAADFKEFGVDPSRWRHTWLKPDGKVGRSTKWVPIEGVELADQQHPDVAAKIAAERTP